jgi:hypothetical protein
VKRRNLLQEQALALDRGLVSGLNAINGAAFAFGGFDHSSSSRFAATAIESNPVFTAQDAMRLSVQAPPVRFRAARRCRRTPKSVMLLTFKPRSHGESYG